MKGDDSSSEKNGVKVVPRAQPTPAPAKPVRESKYKAFKSGVGLIVGALRETGPVQASAEVKVKEEPSPATPKQLTIKNQDLSLLSSMFLKEIATHYYICFVKVLESESNAEVLVSVYHQPNSL
jgi:Ni,Fe-hydrogenase III component G